MFSWLLLFMPKIIARETIAKKEMLILFWGSYCSCIPSIFIFFWRERRFMLIRINLYLSFFLFERDLKMICIIFCIFVNFLRCRVRSFVRLILIITQSRLLDFIAPEVLRMFSVVCGSNLIFALLNTWLCNGFL